MWEFIKRHWIWGVVLLVVVICPLVAVPIAESLSVLGNFLHTAGNASENLSLYGSVFGALATIGAVMATIAHTKKSQKDERAFSLERLKKQLINERKTRDLERIKVYLQGVATVLAPSRFVAAAAPMDFRNHREKATQLLSMSLDCTDKISLMHTYPSFKNTIAN